MDRPADRALYLEVRSRNKLEILCRLLDMYDPELSLVFFKHNRVSMSWTSQLQTRGTSQEGLHGT